MRIFLIGMMGSGKTTIGRKIAEILDLDFMDMDDEIEKREGMRIKDIFEMKGEDHFRKAEKRLLKEVLNRDDIVVSTGGGVILDEENREILKKERTIFLYLPIEEIMSRVETENRPLLKDGKGKLVEIWRKRKNLYEQFDRVDLSGLNVMESTAKVILSVVEEGDLPEYFITTVHPVKISAGSFKSLKDESHGRFHITSENVFRIYGEFFHTSPMIVPDGEKAKDLEIAMRCYEKLVDEGFSKKDTIVGIGGGSVTDLAGFIAGTFKRGTKLEFYPTTLLSQVDASIGGKNGLNFKGIKNMIGTVKMPDRVLIDPVVPISMDERFDEGLVEAFKIFVLFGDGYHGFKEKIDDLKKRKLKILLDLIKKAVELKLKVVERDPNDEGIRHSLNFGHTLGHVFEAIKKLPHGICVGWGMVKEMEFFRMKGFVSDEMVDDVEETVGNLIGDGILKMNVDVEEAFEYLRNDKKGSGDLVRMPVIHDVGRFEFKSFRLGEILEVLG